MKKSELMMKNQIDKTIEYKDAQDKKRQKKVTMRDPGSIIATELKDNLDTGAHAEKRWVDVANLIMDNVIINPKMSFDSQNKALKDAESPLLTHEFHGKNQAGDDITIKMVFPDYRTAMDIVLNVRRGDEEESNLANTAKKLMDHVLRKADGSAMPSDYFDFGNEGKGLFMDVYGDAMEYLSKVLNHDGFLNAIAEGTRFLGNTLRNQ